MSLRKLLNPDADLPLYKFKPQPDITVAELALIVANLMPVPVRVRANDENFELLKRHFEKVKD